MCGIAGVYTPGKDVVSKLATILEKEWNRGHTSFGIETYDVDGTFHVRKGRGGPTIKSLKRVSGDLGIGHLRYSTRGSNDQSFLENNAQPMALHFYPRGEGIELERCDIIPRRDLRVKSLITAAHNGDIFSNGEQRDYFYQCDVKYLVWPFADELSKDYDGTMSNKKIFEVARKVIPTLKGSFSYVGFVADRNGNGTMFAGRDPWGIKPGFIGKLDGGWAVASEDAALVSIGCDASDISEMERGHFYIMDSDKNLNGITIKEGPRASCAFEYVYFEDIASTFEGKNVENVREGLGQRLGKESPAEADIAVPIPDSGRSLATGYAHATGIRYREGFSKNRKRNKRTFILQRQKQRDREVSRKMIPIRAVMEDKRVVLIDDSLVRGTTMSKLVKMVRNMGGASEVHVRIGCPPIVSPCYLGIDMKARGEFAASRAAHELGYDVYREFETGTPVELRKDEMNEVVEKVKEQIDADSLGYLSLEALEAEVGKDCCFGCWSPSRNPTELRGDIINSILEYPDGYRV